MTSVRHVGVGADAGDLHHPGLSSLQTPPGSPRPAPQRPASAQRAVAGAETGPLQGHREEDLETEVSSQTCNR